jgi:hypothetical protein
MKTRDRLHTPAVEGQLAKEDRGRRVVAKAKANQSFMAGVRASIEARLRGEKGTPFEDLKRKDAGA